VLARDTFRIPPVECRDDIFKQAMIVYVRILIYSSHLTILMFCITKSHNNDKYIFLCFKIPSKSRDIFRQSLQILAPSFINVLSLNYFRRASKKVYKKNTLQPLVKSIRTFYDILNQTIPLRVIIKFKANQRFCTDVTSGCAAISSKKIFCKSRCRGGGEV
jgi:hypothetical protein